jgi:hypothetical protein
MTAVPSDRRTTPVMSNGVGQGCSSEPAAYADEVATSDLTGAKRSRANVPTGGNGEATTQSTLLIVGEPKFVSSTASLPLAKRAQTAWQGGGAARSTARSDNEIGIRVQTCTVHTRVFVYGY